MKWEHQTVYGSPNIETMSQIMQDRNIEPFTRTSLLTSALATPFKELARAHYQVLIKSGKFRSQGIMPEYDHLTTLGLDFSSMKTIDILPKYSWSLTVKFCLSKPYLSQDDVSFYIIENPLRKDKVFMVPMIAPSQWKGALHAATVQRLVCEAADLSNEAFAKQRYHLTLLFGDEKGEDGQHAAKGLARLLNEQKPEAKVLYEQKVKRYFLIDNDKSLPNHAGRLRFYPTFFTEIGLEVINPHDRARKVGTNPIYFECVPSGAEAAFTLLYVPFDLMGKTEPEIRTHAANDLYVVAQGLNDMFTLYGFGAKTSSGYGVAEETFRDKGRLSVKATDPAEKERVKIPVEPKEPEIVHNFRQQYPGEDFSEKPKLWRQLHNASSAKQNKYKEAKHVYRQYRGAVKDYYATLSKIEEAKATPTKTTTDRMFKSFPELIEKMSDLASYWRQGDE